MGGAVRCRRGIYNPTADAVWLAAAAPAAKTVLDVGIGSGGVSLCYLAHHSAAQVWGIDTSPNMLQAAADNAQLNDFPINLIQADIYSWRPSQTFDLVLTNPPYFQGTPAKHNAHHNADLGLWMRRCVARVRPRGTLCTIVDAAVLDTVLAALHPTCGDIMLVPLFGAGITAQRVIIRAKNGSHGPTRLFPGVSMNDERILRDGLTMADFFTTLGPKC